MSKQVTVLVNRAEGAKGRLRTLRKNVNTPQPAWREVGRYINGEVREQFRTNGAHFGTPWKPLALSTIMDKVRKGFTKAPLVRTGDLKREFTSRPLDTEIYYGKTARFGSSSDIAKWQHFGTKLKGRRHIPPRKILVSTPKLRRDIRRIVEKHVKGRR